MSGDRPRTLSFLVTWVMWGHAVALCGGCHWLPCTHGTSMHCTMPSSSLNNLQWYLMVGSSDFDSRVSGGADIGVVIFSVVSWAAIVATMLLLVVSGSGDCWLSGTRGNSMRCTMPIHL